ncbi:DivIVA domain-containing protein [Auritidibacter ignavus]|uniref:DivIVA domain-containing protein n=1 Tax=Auritidibacter ignavus TaxID=678932 RepID=UPI00109C5834|nr:DivIVA domain-containing protein [Auritidibacter ignavus]
MGVNLFLIEILALGVVVVAAIALALAKPQVRHLVRPLAEPERALPPVLVPPADRLRPDDIDQIRFSTALRGYRADQVDQVLDRLTEALAERDRKIIELGGTVPVADERSATPQSDQ